MWRGAHTRRMTKEDVLCGVCAKNMGPKNGACPNTGITCDLQHSCCIDCVRANVTPVPKCSPKCLGLRYTCPLCDAPHCVSPFHALTLIKGNWLAANECFTQRHDIIRWNANDPFTGAKRSREVY